MNGHKLTELIGEKIEGLLWDAGCDFRLHEIDEDTFELHVGVGEHTVKLGELYFEEDEKWMVDPLTLTMDLYFQDENVGSDITIVESEDELVERLLALAGN